MPVSALPWLEQPWREILVRRSTLPHALLFKGREGIGELDFVRKLAQSLAFWLVALDRMANLDVAPTIAKLMGLKLPQQDGRDAPGRGAVAGPPSQRAIRQASTIATSRSTVHGPASRKLT